MIIFKQLPSFLTIILSLIHICNRFQRLSGELIAKHVLNRPEFDDCAILKPYRRDEFGWRALNKDYFAYGKPCYVPVKYPYLKDVLDVIELTGGISVLAHPGKLLVPVSYTHLS